MIAILFLIWSLFPVPERPVTAGDFTPPNRPIKFRQIFICYPNSPVHIGVNVCWFDRNGEIYFYKPIEIQINVTKY